MSFELPRDAEGREIPLDTEHLYMKDGTKQNVDGFMFSRKDAEWSVETHIAIYDTEELYLTPPDSWEKLEEDLGRGVTTLSSNDAVCDYFDRGSGYDRCKGCPAGKRSSCTVAVLEDVAARIRKLRGEE